VLYFVALLAGFLQAPSAQAPALVEAGIELSHQGRFNEAAEKFVRALAMDPKLAEAHYLLGLVRQTQGRAAAALQSFRSALDANPRYAEAQARVCELLTVFARAKDSGYDEARDSCRAASALDANDPEPHFHAGWNEAKLGNLAAAIQEYETVLRLNPKFPKVKFELSMAYLDTRETDRAIALLRDVLAAEPGNGAASFQLGAALAKKDDCEGAVPLLEAGAEVPQKYYVLAGCLKKIGREAEAAAAMARVKDLRTGADARMQAKYRAAVAHQKAQAGDLDGAIKEYRAALALVRDSSIAVDLAVALLKKGDAEEVVRLLGGEPDSLARYQLALAYSKLRRFQDARAILEIVLQSRPEFVEAWYQLGINSLAAGDPREAENSLRRAVELRPDEPAIRLAWADSLEKLGKRKEAGEQRTLAGRFPK